MEYNLSILLCKKCKVKYMFYVATNIAVEFVLFQNKSIPENQHFETLMIISTYDNLLK